MGQTHVFYSAERIPGQPYNTIILFGLGRTTNLLGAYGEGRGRP